MCFFFPPLENVNFRKLPFFPLKVHSLHLLYPQHLVVFIIFLLIASFRRIPKTTKKVN